jgi:hypothetical protein
MLQYNLSTEELRKGSKWISEYLHVTANLTLLYFEGADVKCFIIMKNATLKTSKIYIHLIIREGLNTANAENLNSYVEYDKATEIAMRKADEIEDNTETTVTELGDVFS